MAFKLSKRKADDNLQLLHTILFGKKAKVIQLFLILVWLFCSCQHFYVYWNAYFLQAQTLKRNISQFSGYVWIENEVLHRLTLTAFLIRKSLE